jgi:hypothetical protein
LLLLQHGCPVDALRRALTRNGDGTVLDLLQQQQNQGEAAE